MSNSLINERIQLVARIVQINEELGDYSMILKPKKKLGRPKGSTKKNKLANSGLKDILCKIAFEANKPLKVADFVVIARKSDYKTEAKDFSNMVYQSLRRLVELEIFVKNDDKEYVFVGEEKAIEVAA